MDVRYRIESTLEGAIAAVDAPDCPPKLAAAIRHAVFPGGARLRPRLCIAVAASCGDDEPEIANVAATSIELLHCASLVHDDLPCFDDAIFRRGRPTVHQAFGEPIAVLAGDALIVLAMELLAGPAVRLPHRSVALTRIVARAVGVPAGIVSGQAWECESHVRLADYHRAKTGALFAGATMAGAAAAGHDPTLWRTLGDRIGEAYQVADDIRDVAAEAGEFGKPLGQDAHHERPSAVRDLGVTGALSALKRLVADAVDSIPDCPGAAELRDLIAMEARRFLPRGLAQDAA